MLNPDYIKKLRKKAGYSQAYLAAELGISRPTYVQVELGERELTISEAQKLAGIFNLTLEAFLRGGSPVETKVRLEAFKKANGPENKLMEMRISVPQENVKKFKSVLLYLLKKIGGKPNVGMTVLYKLLYFIDFDYYEKFEEQLMGAVYIRNHYGPTPVMFGKIVKELEKAGQIEKISSKFYKYDQKKYLINPKCEPDLSVLSAREVEHINEVLGRLGDKNATELMELSHKDVPWIVAKPGQRLSYESVFYRADETSVRVYDDEL